MLEALTAWESFVGALAFGAFYAAAHVVHWLRYAWLERDYLTFSNRVRHFICSLRAGWLQMVVFGRTRATSCKSYMWAMPLTPVPFGIATSPVHIQAELVCNHSANSASSCPIL